MEKFDNKIENIIFSNILKSDVLSKNILRIYNLIYSQNIDLSDKEFLAKKIIGVGIINENEEILALLENIRDDNIKESLVYKVFFEFIEDILDVRDENHLKFLMSNKKEELETDIIYFFKRVLYYIEKELKNIFSKKESIFEVFSKDYLDNNEKEELNTTIDNYFKDFIKFIKSTEQKKELEDKIKKTLAKYDEIQNIK